ncbi:Fur family transcriptional regulator [Longimycelium tulufanense]|nr:Fur family transcriptional regulator [Longimycelium tulufanense]
MTPRTSTYAQDQPADLRQRLRAAGLRVTAPRLAVLTWVSDHPHVTADEVTTAVRERLGSVSTQAVYDVLNACTRAGLLRRIEPAGHPARFETRIGDNHHHLVCRACGRTEDVDCLVGARPCLDPSDTSGFEVDEAEVVFWGWCPDCRDAGRAPTTRSHHEEEGRA